MICLSQGLNDILKINAINVNKSLNQTYLINLLAESILMNFGIQKQLKLLKSETTHYILKHSKMINLLLVLIIIF